MLITEVNKLWFLDLRQQRTGRNFDRDEPDAKTNKCKCSPTDNSVPAMG